MKILLTGGHGHLAQAFIRLFGEVHDVTATVRTPRIETPSRARFVVAPDANALAEVLDSGRFDAIIHLAQSGAPGAGPVDGIERIRDEAALFSVILGRLVAGEVDRLFVASTGGLYADSQHPLRETDRLLEPPNLDVYYASKLMLETMISPHFDQFNVTIGRFFFIYGPGQGESKLLSRLIESVRSNRPVMVSPTGGVKMNPIYVDDAARAVESCVSLDGSRIVNVAGPQTTSIHDLTERIGRIAGVPPVYAPGGQDRNLVADISILLSITDDGLVDLDEGLKRTMSPAAT